MRFHGRFFKGAILAILPVAALVLLTPAALTAARAETAQAAPSDNSKTSIDKAAIDQANPSEQKSLAGKAIDISPCSFASE